MRQGWRSVFNSSLFIHFSKLLFLILNQLLLQWPFGWLSLVTFACVLGSLISTFPPISTQHSISIFLPRLIVTLTVMSYCLIFVCFACFDEWTQGLTNARQVHPNTELSISLAFSVFSLLLWGRTSPPVNEDFLGIVNLLGSMIFICEQNNSEPTTSLPHVPPFLSYWTLRLRNHTLPTLITPWPGTQYPTQSLHSRAPWNDLSWPTLNQWLPNVAKTRYSLKIPAS